VSGLRVTRLALQDVGVIRGRVDLGALDPQITLITGANETGKSTVVEALRCALFEKHNAGHAGIRVLQPHGTNLSPQVWVDFVVGGRRYELHKQFLKGAMTELRIDDAEALVGAEADEAVWDCLGSSRPGNRGAKREDMGIWGLLWVSQDEAAAADPGTKIGEETRGALQDVIGRQVGQIVGGRHGERIRTRAKEEARRYWTPTLAHPTGELAAALERRDRAAAAVEVIRGALQAVEEEADRSRGLRVEIEELVAVRPALEREVAGASERTEQVAVLAQKAEIAAEKLATARARHGESEAAWTARCELATSLAAAEERLSATTTQLTELAITVGERTEAASAVAAVAELAAQQATTADEARAAAERELERSRRISEAFALAQKLARGRELAEQLADLQKQERSALDDVSYRRLVELGDRRRELAARLAGEAPGSDLAAATGPDTLEVARERRRERIQLEVQREEIADTLAEQAPDGIEALAAAAAAGRTTLTRDQAGLEGAVTLTTRLEGLRTELAANPVDEGALDRVTRRAQRVEVARARSEAIGTAVEVTALGDLAVARDGDDPTALAAGESMTWTLDQPGRLRLGDVAELTVTPGGEEVAEAGARVETAEASLADLLGELGLDDIETARERAAAWAGIRDRVRDAEVALAEQAPMGLDALRAAVDDARAEQAVREGRLETVRELGDRQKLADQALAVNPLTASALAHLEELARLDGELRRALGDTGAGSLEEAGRSWKDGLTLAQQIAGARSALEELAPAGIEVMETGAAAAECEPGAAEEVDLPALEWALAGARDQAGEARAAAAEARRQADMAETGRATCVTEVANREGARDNEAGEVERELARLETARAVHSDADLETRRGDVAAVLGEATESLRIAEAALAAASPELLEGDAERAGATLADNRSQEKRLDHELTRLKARMEVAAAEGRFEQLGEAEAELSDAEDSLARVERAAAGARRLVQEVDRAYAEAQRRFLAPVVKEARPYLSAIRPGTEIRMTEDLTVAKVLRRGVEEDFDQLSGGTREQLSVIVRLALARVLARDEDAEPLPLILDDTMGWTDEPRFVEMVRILRNASKQFQLIVLTCHPSRFARLQPGRTIELDTLRREAREAKTEDAE
jgi:DNA repair exonuclease SbcCD ATPase subunit